MRQGLLFRGAVAADETDALRNLGHRGFPMIFVLDGNVTLEALLFQLVQNGRNVANARAVGQVVRVEFAELVQVFQVTADDPAFENTQALDRFQA